MVADGRALQCCGSLTLLTLLTLTRLTRTANASEVASRE